MSNYGLPVPMEDAFRKHRERLGCFVGRVTYLKETGSTNDKAIELALAGAPEGTTVVAGAQTAGRGRRGRSWLSPRGTGLYASVVFRPPLLSPVLTLMSGVALVEAIRCRVGLAVVLKWPNDLIVKRGVNRKLGGILAEAGASPTGVKYVVVGFGINLLAASNLSALSDTATSIESECGEVIPLADLLVEVLAALAVWRARMVDGQMKLAQNLAKFVSEV